MNRATPGLLFLFRGPRFGWFRRQLLPGVVLAVEPDAKTVHITLLNEPEVDEAPLDVEIGLMPIGADAFMRSVVQELGRKEVGNYWWQALHEWRELEREELTGGFSVPIWEARNMAWLTVQEANPNASPTNFYLEYALPFAPERGMPLERVRVSATAKQLKDEQYQ